MNSLDDREQLIRDFKILVTDAEALLKATFDQSGNNIEEARSRTEETIRAAKARMAEVQEDVLNRTTATAKATDKYVHENPWESVGVAAVVGILIGWILGRR